MSAREPDEEGARKLISGGSEIAGGAVGGALGFLAGGPAGAVLGGAAGPAAVLVLRRVGQELSRRLLGPREEIRAGGVLAVAVDTIRERIGNGEQLRTDGFFDARPEGRADADELVESVILKCQREPEERKIPYMGYLLSSLAFDSGINREMGHQLTRAAEQLTYRQLCILKLAVVKDGFQLRSSDYRRQGSFQRSLSQVLYECFDLYQRGYVNFGGEVLFGPADVWPARMKVQGLGAELFNLMNLRRIPDADLAPIAAQLK